MLKLKARHQQSYKCPRHPRHQYSESVPASCEVCHSISDVQTAAQRLDQAERKAQQAIARVALTTRGARA